MFGFDDAVPPKIRRRREVVFMVLSGLFLGSLTMLNILGTTRFIDMSFEVGSSKVPFVLTVGVLPYPITFLCTDFISEIYGRARANLVVWIGVMLNFWVLLVLWLGGSLPGAEETGGYSDDAFMYVRGMAFATITASMLAYMAAQFCDVHIFHFFKKLTKGKHLWLRNNASTMTSQLVDSFAVILIVHYFTGGLPIKEELAVMPQLMTLIFSAYIFKFTVALLDTVPFYYGTKMLSRYLQVDPNEEFEQIVRLEN